ncbi:DUF6882 domain-containing protein [Gordonia sp. VNQ95]|uniref:DUF6882 domain-containing protein n=1 Tax=Gordonia TaxID=2053 RepID=UPI0032B50536
MHLDGLRAVADCGAWYARLRRDMFDAFLARELSECTATFTGTRVVFTSVDDPRRLVETHASLVATLASDASRARWGWAVDAGPTDLSTAELRRAAERLGLTAMSVPEMPIGPPQHPTGNVLDTLGTTLGAVAVQLLGRGPDMCVVRPDGGRDVVLLTDVALPEPTFADFVAALPDLLADVEVGDHRVAVHGLAARRGWHIRWQTPGPAEATHRFDVTEPGASMCLVSDGRAVTPLWFDRAGRGLTEAAELSA